MDKFPYISPVNEPTNKRPIFRNGFLFALLLLLIVAKVFLSLALPQQRVRATDLSTENILNAVNRERSLRNLVTLNTDYRLSEAAQTKADDMMNRHYFAHINPDGQYIWPTIEADGYKPYLQLGENLAIEFYDTDSLMAAWMNSPTHRENILNEGFRDQGMGMALGDTNAGQYHSAIANTFGTLLAAPKPKPTPVAAPTPAPVAQPKPAPVKKPAPIKPSITPTPTQPTPTPQASVPPPVKAAETDSQGFTQPLQPRETGELAQGQPTEQATSAAANIDASSSVPATFSSPAVVNNTPQTPAAPGGFNQTLILGFGVLLLLLMIADIRSAAQKKLGFLDRKINNLAVLVITLIVIAFLYWL